jgi:hypothetical protein
MWSRKRHLNAWSSSQGIKRWKGSHLPDFLDIPPFKPMADMAFLRSFCSPSYWPSLDSRTANMYGTDIGKGHDVVATFITPRKGTPQQQGFLIKRQQQPDSINGVSVKRLQHWRLLSQPQDRNAWRDYGEQIRKSTVDGLDSSRDLPMVSSWRIWACSRCVCSPFCAARHSRRLL